MTIPILGALAAILLIGMALGATITYMLCVESQPLIDGKPVVWPSLDV